MTAAEIIKDIQEAIARLEARERAIGAQLAAMLAVTYRDLRDFQRDHDEYIEDMSLGGRRYKP